MAGLSAYGGKKRVVRRTHFVHVTEVLEASFRVDDREVNIQVAVWLLRLLDHVDEFFDRTVKFLRMSTGPAIRRGKKIASSFDPI